MPPTAQPTHPGRGGRRRWSPVATIALVVAVIVGVVLASEAMRVIQDAAEQRTIAAFYEQPRNVADGDPGTLVKSVELAGTPFASRAWRIMYRSTDLRGEPIVVTGIVVAPNGPAPDGGRRVLAWGHPTTGTDASCAPSRGFDPFIGIEGLRMMLDRGYAVVATDYAGMGTDGPDSYLVRLTAAHTMLDAVRAARGIPDARAGDEVVLWGHSQGGQAVIAAAEEAGDYAPELRIAAVAAAAPAADLTALMGSHLDDISGVTIGSYAFPAFSGVYADVPGTELDGILTPAAIAKNGEMNRLCLLTHLDELHDIGQPLVGDFFLHDPTATEPWEDLLAENSVGQKAFAAPLFIAQGADDQLVLPNDTEDFVAQVKRLGVEVDYVEVPLATHATIAYLALPALALWLDGQDL